MLRTPRRRTNGTAAAAANPKRKPFFPHELCRSDSFYFVLMDTMGLGHSSATPSNPEIFVMVEDSPITLRYLSEGT